MSGPAHDLADTPGGVTSLSIPLTNIVNCSTVTVKPPNFASNQGLTLAASPLSQLNLSSCLAVVYRCTRTHSTHPSYTL